MQVGDSRAPQATTVQAELQRDDCLMIFDLSSSCAFSLCSWRRIATGVFVTCSRNAVKTKFEKSKFLVYQKPRHKKKYIQQKMKLLNLAFLTTFHFTNSLPVATELSLEDQNAFSRITEISKFEAEDDHADDNDLLIDRSRRSLRSERKHRRSKKDRRRKEKDRRNRRRKRNKEKKNKKDRRFNSSLGFHKLKNFSFQTAPTHDRIRKHLSDPFEPSPSVITSHYRRPQVPCFRGLDRLSMSGFGCGLNLS
ncbi:unnamed protein product [Oikopleura dioica]|uniref:Uncharacterized protein n=1 Tax=Oikopleura dioica TaxID=34765 RepID=E4XKE7_OIKDI|nr:unnamed protein product [Oikopleura dioica]